MFTQFNLCPLVHGKERIAHQSHDTKGDGKISVQPHTTLYIQFLTRENNEKNNTFPLEKQICFDNSMGLCGNFTKEMITTVLRFICGHCLLQEVMPHMLSK